MKQVVKYNIDPINQKYPDANYYLIFGQKSNGKSYQVKHKEGVLHYVNTSKKFALVRRWREDLSTSWIEKYFGDVDVEKITNGEFNAITQYRKDLFFSKIDDKMKVKKGYQIGTCIPLSREQHMSGVSMLDYDRIIFEEFMERGVYVPHESSRLEILYNTIDRGRGVTKCYMVGNTISRVCPYLQDWNLLNVVRNLKQGQMTEVKTGNKIIVNGKEIDTSIAIEYCAEIGGNKLSFGQASSMIDSGSWQTESQPKLLESKNSYNIEFRIGFEYMGFRFIGELLSKKDNLIWFIYPFNGEFDSDIFIFSDKVMEDYRHFRDIYNIPQNLKLHNFFNQTFRESNIFFSDDLTGTDFKNAIDFTIKK